MVWYETFISGQDGKTFGWTHARTCDELSFTHVIAQLTHC
jgi:hypothetical protein